ncbi:hypothetical protein [uncultured Microbacterium sp.]|uniref:hypothetical protein n=1 Tax=uncultured Microbacterium sp. TaxID=191216 RepID=UPI0025F9B4C3|nr:hypothetical protein [uncultured Microbacterium sp.]
MDQVGDWIGWAFGAIGVAFGVLGEVRARRAEKRLRAQDDAPPWADVTHISGNLFAIKNQSTRDVVVSGIEPDMSRPSHLFHTDTRHHLPLTVQAGESMEFVSEARLTLPPANPKIEWRFADSKGTRTTRHLLPQV